MVVSTHLKNISQNGNLPQIGVNIKNVSNHHLDFMRVVLLCRTSFDAGHVGGRDPQRGLASNSSSKTKRDLDKVEISTAVCCTWAILYTYGWCKKSCTSWYGKYPMIYRVSLMLGGAGYSFSLQLPNSFSLQLPKTNSLPMKMMVSNNRNLQTSRGRTFSGLLLFVLHTGPVVCAWLNLRDPNSIGFLRSSTLKSFRRIPHIETKLAAWLSGAAVVHASTKIIWKFQQRDKEQCIITSYPTLFDLGPSQTYSKFIKSPVFLLKVATLRIFSWDGPNIETSTKIVGPSRSHQSDGFNFKS